MERVEIPAVVYWKSKSGKKFNNQETCEKYERLFDKWNKPSVYREIENVEGQCCYVYWVETKEDLDDLIWFIRYNKDISTCNYIEPGDKPFEPQWIVASPDYNEYNAEMAIRTLEDMRDITEDTLKAARDTLGVIVKLLWEKV